MVDISAMTDVTNKHVIISGDEGVIEEDKISICNDKYTVIGTYSVGGYNILPISSINDVKHNNESVSIVLDKYPVTMKIIKLFLIDGML